LSSPIKKKKLLLISGGKRWSQKRKRKKRNIRQENPESFSWGKEKKKGRIGTSEREKGVLEERKGGKREMNNKKSC